MYCGENSSNNLIAEDGDCDSIKADVDCEDPDGNVLKLQKAT